MGHRDLAVDRTELPVADKKAVSVVEAVAVVFVSVEENSPVFCPDGMSRRIVGYNGYTSSSPALSEIP